MLPFVNECGEWMRFSAAILKTREAFEIRIVLQRNSLAHAFLAFFSQQTVETLMPIDENISTTCEGSECKLILQQQETVFIQLQFESEFFSNVFNTQVTLCSHISCHMKFPFRNEFVRFILPRSQSLEKLKLTPKIIPYLPISDDKSAQKSWIIRSNTINLPYYTKFESFKAFLLTWNVEEKKPDRNTQKQLQFIFDKQVDLIVIVLQEIDFSAKAVLFGGSELTSEWNQMFQHAAKECDYEPIAGAALGGVYLILLKNLHSKFRISAKIIDTMRLGVSGIAANKSAILSIITVEQVNIALTGAHLSAQTENAELRCEQISHILERYINQYWDFMILLGDLNFRVEMTYQEVLELIKNKEIHKIQAHDQLNRYLQDHPIVSQFTEFPFSFNPTFRFDDDSSNYDSSPKHRTPSWTDRILIRTNQKRLAIGPRETLVFETDALYELINNKIEVKVGDFESAMNFPSSPLCESYRSYDIQISDHRPVGGEFLFHIPVIDEKRKKAYLDVQTSKLDEIAQLSVPVLIATPNKFDLNEEFEFTLKNGSLTIANWEIECVPPGVTFSPKKGVLMPQEAIQIVVRCKSHVEANHISMVSMEIGSPVVIEYHVI